MRKEIAKLIAGAAGIGFVVLMVAIGAQMVGRENVLERITQWPDLAVQTLEADEFTTAQLVSGTPILFNYFSTECMFCQAEITDIANHKELQETATLVFISNEPPDIIKQFRRSHGLDKNPNFLFLVDTGKQVKEYYRIRSVPATYLYNPDGELIEFFRGQIKAETLYSHITGMNSDQEE